MLWTQQAGLIRCSQAEPMIRYALVCDSGHEFDGWFEDSAGCDCQMAGGMVVCPTCQSLKIGKGLMTPGLANARHARTPDGQTNDAEPLSETRALRQKLAAWRSLVLASAENVGTDFTSQARRMHEGDMDYKPIYGEASRDDVVTLLEDGVPLLPLPPAPEDQH